MRIGASLFLIALGAILRFAITTNNSHGFNVGTAGVILMIVGVIGLIISVLWMTSRRRTDVVEQVAPATRRTAYEPGTRRTTYVEPNDTVEPPY